MKIDPPDFMVSGQPFWVVGDFPYERQDGTMTKIYNCKSFCPECGTQFETTVPANAQTPNVARRCEACRRVGRRIKQKDLFTGRLREF
jgi:hypothetical protein